MPITIADKTIMDRSIVNHQGMRFAGSVMARTTMKNSLYGYELPHSLWVPFPRNATEGRYADGAWLVTTREPSRDELHEADGKTPTTKDIAAVVYRVRRNSEGHPVISEAQHASTRDALYALRSRQLVEGKQDIAVTKSGKRIFARRGQGRPERCCFWSMVRSDASV